MSLAYSSTTMHACKAAQADPPRPGGNRPAHACARVLVCLVSEYMRVVYIHPAPRDRRGRGRSPAWPPWHSASPATSRLLSVGRVHVGVGWGVHVGVGGALVACHSLVTALLTS